MTGCNSQAHGEFAGNVESTNLGRDNISREIGRNICYSRFEIGQVETILYRISIAYPLHPRLNVVLFGL